MENGEWRRTRRPAWISILNSQFSIPPFVLAMCSLIAWSIRWAVRASELQTSLVERESSAEGVVFAYVG